MDSILNFLSQYGVALCLIAILGIVVLGVLKYSNAFKKLDEEKRHYAYIGVALAISLLGSGIYLACIKSFEWNYFFALAGAIYALDQTFYNLFKVTSLNELGKKLLDVLVVLIKKLFEKKDDENKQ